MPSTANSSPSGSLPTAQAPGRPLWVGGYSREMDGGATGIGLLRHTDGRWHDFVDAAPAASPSFLFRNADVVYAAGESGPTVSAFRVTGNTLKHLVTVEAAGPFPCSLTVAGPFLLTASYGDGAVGVHRLDAAGVPGPVIQTLTDEGTGPHPAQDGPHAHDALQVDASTVLTTDLGTDRVHIHRLTPDGLERTGSVQLPAGSGPRDLRLVSPGTVLVLAELGCAVFVLRDAGDGFALSGSAALPGTEPGDQAAALAISADGRWLYAGLRGSNRVSWLEVSMPGAATREATAGGPTVTGAGYTECGGDWPRHLTVLDGSLLVANQRSGSVSVFTLDPDGTPHLRDTVAVPTPTYLLPV